MEKVKVTQEQADWLDKYEKTQEQIDFYIDIHLLNKRPDAPIAGWAVSKVARALYIGYEVEPKFVDGDWIVHEETNVIRLVTDHDTYFINNEYIDRDKLRHATPEEIVEEKERSLFAENDREPWELKEHDVLVNKDDGTDWAAIYIIESENMIGLFYFKDSKRRFGDMKFIKENFNIVSFAEDRKDIV